MQTSASTTVLVLPWLCPSTAASGCAGTGRSPRWGWRTRRSCRTACWRSWCRRAGGIARVQGLEARHFALLDVHMFGEEVASGFYIRDTTGVPPGIITALVRLRS